MGLLFAFGGALGQAGGSLLSKIGLAGGLPAISGNAIRLTAAVILIRVWAIVRGQLVTTYQTVHQDPRAMAYVAIATLARNHYGIELALPCAKGTELTSAAPAPV
jgi:hypothetical protein